MTIMSNPRIRACLSVPAFLYMSLTVPAAAQWMTNGVEASATSNHAVEPEISVDTFGGALVVWSENSDGIDPIGDVYVQRYASDGTTVWGNSGVLLSAPLANGIFYRVVPDGEAGAIVLWGASSGSYVQRVNFLGSKVWGFSGVEYAPGNPASATASKVGSHYGIHDLLPLAGGALIAFRKTGTLDFDIFIQKVDPSGVIQWGANGVTVCNAAGLQFNPLIVSDTESGAIIAWVDDRIGTRSIYAQRVNFLGTPLWTANGVLICTATGNRGQLVMVSDDAGGAVIGWVDLRNAWQDVYAQRVDASGVPQWTTNGEPVAVLASNQTALSMAGNDQGGAYLAWTDTRLPQTEDIEVFGQLMDFDGIARWGANGLRLTNESAGLLTSPSTYAARDGAGGVIVAYTTLEVVS